MARAVRGLVAVSGYLIGSQEANRKPLPPNAELAWWYQFYFATDRGRAGYERVPRATSPGSSGRRPRRPGTSTTTTFDRSAAAFDNPDHVDIVIHNYRWRIGIADGESSYDELEARLAQARRSACRRSRSKATRTAAPPPTPAPIARSSRDRTRIGSITGGVGHNLPQEAPRAFADAVIEVEKLGPCRGAGGWLARKDSNLRSPDPESGALPLGHSPVERRR